MAKLGKAGYAVASRKVAKKVQPAPAATPTKNKSEKKSAAALKPAPKAQAMAKPAVVSQKLLQVIEQRKNSKAGKAPSNFGKPPGRRGRRPKQPVEYVPEHQEEEGAAAENEIERLEYDTGIQVKSGKDEGGFNFDRFEEFDEELNFDW